MTAGWNSVESVADISVLRLLPRGNAMPSAQLAQRARLIDRKTFAPIGAIWLM
jgi:hypothetical protein